MSSTCGAAGYELVTDVLDEQGIVRYTINEGDEITLERGDLPAGLLYYTTKVDGFTATRKMIVGK